MIVLLGRVFLAAVLGTAAVGKALGVLSGAHLSPWLLLATVGEALLAASLLLSKTWRTAALLVSGGFAGAMVVNTLWAFSAGGRTSCGCLGVIAASRWTALALEGFVVAVSTAILGAPAPSGATVAKPT